MHNEPMKRVTLLLREEQVELLASMAPHEGGAPGGVSAVVRAMIDGFDASGITFSNKSSERKRARRIERLLWWGALVEECAAADHAGKPRPWLREMRGRREALVEALQRPGVTPSVLAHSACVDLAAVQTLLMPLVVRAPPPEELERIARACAERLGKPTATPRPPPQMPAQPDAAKIAAAMGELRTRYLNARDRFGLSQERVAGEAFIPREALEAFCEEPSRPLEIDDAKRLATWLKAGNFGARR